MTKRYVPVGTCPPVTSARGDESNASNDARQFHCPLPRWYATASLATPPGLSRKTCTSPLSSAYDCHSPRTSRCTVTAGSSVQLSPPAQRNCVTSKRCTFHG